MLALSHVNSRSCSSSNKTISHTTYLIARLFFRVVVHKVILATLFLLVCILFFLLCVYVFFIGAVRQPCVSLHKYTRYTFVWLRWLGACTCIRIVYVCVSHWLFSAWILTRQSKAMTFRIGVVMSLLEACYQQQHIFSFSVFHRKPLKIIECLRLAHVLPLKMKNATHRTDDCNEEYKPYSISSMRLRKWEKLSNQNHLGGQSPI